MRRPDFRSWLDAVRGAEMLSGPARVLAGHLADAMPERGTVLLIGASKPLFAALGQLRPDLRIERFEPGEGGPELPFAAQSVDYVALVDVHRDSEHVAGLLAEAAVVARRSIVLKDRQRAGFLAVPALLALDGLTGRSRPDAYLDRREWQRVFYRARLTTVSVNERLGCLPMPLGWILERRLHFVALLAVRQRD